jgi:hypothetical protein
MRKRTAGEAASWAAPGEAAALLGICIDQGLWLLGIVNKGGQVCRQGNGVCRRHQNYIWSAQLVEDKGALYTYDSLSKPTQTSVSQGGHS